jgi:hypothetical protein
MIGAIFIASGRVPKIDKTLSIMGWWQVSFNSMAIIGLPDPF